MFIRIEQNQKLMKKDKALKSSTITYKKQGKKEIKTLLYIFSLTFYATLLSFSPFISCAIK
jgi:hypothetical protein